MKTYFLLVITIVTWSVIGYRVFSAINPDAVVFKEEKLALKLKFENNIVRDTFSLSPINKDPFFGNIYSKKIKSNAIKKKKPIIQWNPIIYHGMISKARIKIFVVSINGSQYLLKKNQEKEGVKIVDGNSKKIILKYNGEQKTFKLKE